MIKQEDTLAIIKEFGANETDSGSTAVQIALLTKKIDQLQTHLKVNKKDFSSKRGMLQMVYDRKSLLLYLQRKVTAAEYKDVITRLGIRK